MAFFLVRCQQLRKDPERSSTDPTHKEAKKPERPDRPRTALFARSGTVETQTRRNDFFLLGKALNYSLGGKECFGFASRADTEKAQTHTIILIFFGEI